MRKIFLAALMGIVSMGLVSCSGDDDEKNNGGGGNGYMVVQNLSTDCDIVLLQLYDEDGNLLSTDNDHLKPDYQFTYEIPAGKYIGELKDEKGQTFRSNVFKIIKGKSTVLRYDGTSAWIEATGIDLQLPRQAVRHSLQKHMDAPVERL